jgi:hypothetical protein
MSIYISTLGPYPCLLRFITWDNEGKFSHVRKGTINNFTSKTINVVLEGGKGIIFTYSDNGGWVSDLDDDDRRVDILPDPQESEEHYQAVEAIISLND